MPAEAKVQGLPDLRAALRGIVPKLRRRALRNRRPMPHLRSLAAALLAAALAVPAFAANTPGFNYDESKVRAYTLPDPLVRNNGTPVRDAETWRRERRPELLEIYAREIFGRTPGGKPAGLHEAVTSVDRAALDGKAVRKEVTL